VSECVCVCVCVCVHNLSDSQSQRRGASGAPASHRARSPTAAALTRVDGEQITGVHATVSSQYFLKELWISDTR
jgi:hypothetical protein